MALHLTIGLELVPRCEPSTYFGHFGSEPNIGYMLLLYEKSSQCSTTGVTKAMVCVILSAMMHIKQPLLLIGKSSLCGGSRFPLAI